MIYIVDYKGDEHKWWIGNDVPANIQANIQDVVEVRADGDELERIKLEATNLPMAPFGKWVIRWFGDDAKFIVANLLV